MSLKMILCVSKNFGFAKNNRTPWSIKEELLFFKTQTISVTDERKKNCVIMGRKTFVDIISKPGNEDGLKDRLNFVLSSNKELKEKYKDHKNIKIISDFDELEIIIQNYKNNNFIETFWFIGGLSIFNYALNKGYQVYLNIIEEDYDCDIFVDPFLFNDYTVVKAYSKKHFCFIKNKHVLINYYVINK